MIIIIILLGNNLFNLKSILLSLKKLNGAIKLLDLRLVIDSGLLSARIFLAKVTPITGKNICDSFCVEI